jgi:hypothetical protein
VFGPGLVGVLRRVFGLGPVDVLRPVFGLGPVDVLRPLPALGPSDEGRGPVFAVRSLHAAASAPSGPAPPTRSLIVQ